MANLIKTTGMVKKNKSARKTKIRQREELFN